MADRPHVVTPDPSHPQGPDVILPHPYSEPTGSKDPCTVCGQGPFIALHVPAPEPELDLTAAPPRLSEIAPIDGLGAVDASDGFRGEAPGEALRAWWARFVAVLDPRDLDLLVLWTLHTWFIGLLYTTPRLNVHSPLPDSGKTTVLEHLQRLCPRPLMMSSAGSPALITRVLAAGPRTLLLDETEKNLKPDKEGVGDLLAILNSGYKQGGKRPVLVPAGGGWRAVELPTYAPLAMAGMSTVDLPTDTLSRTIRMLMLPDSAGTVEDSDWEEIGAEAEALAASLKDWADATTLPKPPMPTGVVGRAKERWRPLWRVAAALGGDWPERCRALIEREAEQLEAEREDGAARDVVPMRLLRDIIDYWPLGQESWKTDPMTSALRVHEPQWRPTTDYPQGLTPQRAGRYLSKLGLNTKRDSNGARLGYLRADVEKIARRLGMPGPVQAPVPAHGNGPANDLARKGAPTHLKINTFPLLGTAEPTPPVKPSEASELPEPSNGHVLCAACGEPLSQFAVLTGDTVHLQCPVQVMS